MEMKNLFKAHPSLYKHKQNIIVEFLPVLNYWNLPLCSRQRTSWLQ